MSEEFGPYWITKLTQDERPDDRYLNIQLQPIELGSHKVTVITSVEIENRWHPARELGSNIQQTFIRALLRSSNKSVLTKFEDALKNVNQLLTLSEQKISEPINCTLAVLDAAEVYFSSLNSSSLFLVRHRKAGEINAEERGTSQFSTVTSGEITSDDLLIFASQLLATEVRHLPAETWQNLNKDSLSETLIDRVEPINRPRVAGLLVAYDPASPKQKVLNVDELESRLPIKLPKLPSISTAGAKGFLASTIAVTKTAGLHLLSQLRRIGRPQELLQNWRSFSWKKWAAGAAALLLVIIIIVAITHRRSPTPTKTVSAPTILQLLSSTANSPSATFQFLSNNLTTSNYQNLSSADKATFATDLRQRGYNLALSSSLVSELPKSAVALDTTDQFTYVLDSTGQLWKYQANLIKVDQPTLVANPLSLVALADDRVVASDTAGNIWLFNNTNASPIALVPPANIGKGPKLLQKYNNGLYFYETDTQTIDKVANFTADINGAALALKTQSLNFGPLSDWVINGSYIGAASDGSIKDFRTKLGKVSIAYYQSSTAPIRLTLSGDGKKVVVARGKVISVYLLADNSKISETALVTTDPISDIAAGPNNTLWVTAGTKLYRLGSIL